MAAKTIIISTSYSYVALLLIISPVSISESTSVTGFTTDLIHRDSPLSPFYDPSSTPSQRLINALQRSLHRARARARRFSRRPSKLGKPEPDLLSSGADGEYLIKFSIGTPPVPILAIADTGSDTVWTQCQGCRPCFNQSLPLFSSRNSASYARVPCSSRTCMSLPETHCSPTRRNCLFEGLYADNSTLQGMFATESFTFPAAAGKTVVIPNIVFGCAYRANISFDGIASGIVGLGRGRASLVEQLGQGKFSYCLVAQFHNFDKLINSGKLSFGGEAEVSGRGVVSTPLVVRTGVDETFYFMTMEGISVGKKRIEFYDDHNSSSSVREGNIVIDSGAVLTYLPEALYKALEKAVKSEVKLKQTNDPSGFLGLCFEGERKDFPEINIRVHLRGGDLIWGFENAFVKADAGSPVCLAVKAGDDPTYGNIAQANFVVGYDLVKNTVSFKKAHCGN